MSKLKIKSIISLAVVLFTLHIIAVPVSFISSAYLFKEGHIEDGVLIYRILDKPAKGALNEGELIYGIDDRDIIKLGDMLSYLDGLKPGDRIVIKTNISDHVLTLSNKPYEKDKPYIGVAFRQNYKEQNIPLLKEVLFKLPNYLISSCTVAILIFSTVFLGLINVLIAFFGPVLLLLLYIYIDISRHQNVAVISALKTPVFDKLILALLIIIFVFVIPAKWIKKDDTGHFNKILGVYAVLLLIFSLFGIFNQAFNLSDLIVLPINFAFFVFWSIVLKRIFKGQTTIE